MRYRKLLTLFALVLCLSATTAFAQVTASASVQGRVMDKSSAVVPGAEVKISNKSTGFTRTTSTGQDGLYRFDLLQAGRYEVRVAAKGFATTVIQDVELSVGGTTSLDASLTISQQSDVITVEASAGQIDTTKTDVSRLITPAEVMNLPLNGRDFANLAFLAPGAKPVNSYDPTKNRIGVFGINGSAGRNVNITVNGIDNKDNTVGGPVMQLPLEAVEEFNISTQRFSAANGRSEGAAVNVITKSGTNQLHGSLYLFARDTSLTANDQLNGTSPTPAISRQQYGGSIGGPIVKDKTFAFFTIERVRENTELGVTAAAFTELSLVKALGAQPVNSIPTPYRDQRYNGRLDHRLNRNNNLFVSYNAQGNRGDNDQAAPTNDLTEGNFTTNQLILANITLNSVLKPTVVNSFTFGHQYWNNLIDSTNKVPNVGFPNGISFGTNGNVPQQSYQRKWQYRDDLSINRGRHTFKMGVDFVNEPKLGGFFTTPSTLNVTFQDLPSRITTDKALYPDGFATKGAVTAMSASSGNSYFGIKSGKMFGVYFQDDFKVNNRFMVNLGVRWDVDLHLQGDNQQAQERTYQELKAVNSPFAGIPRTDKNNFSPRVGLAYDLTGAGKHILRAGWGIYYGQTFINLPLFALQQANDTVFTQTLQLSSAGFGDKGATIVPTTGLPLSMFRYGVDPLPAIPAGLHDLVNGAVGRLVDPSFANPYNHQFNGGYEWQIDNVNSIEVSYIHILGLREAKRQNINPLRPDVGNTRPYDAAFTAAKLPVIGQIVVESSIGRSRYDGLNITYKRRLANHFSINTNYVLSRALAYAGGPAAFGNAASNPAYLFDPNDLGPAPNDEKHRWVFTGIWQLPFGIQLAPISQLASARPYNPVQGINWRGSGSSNGTTRAVVKASDPTNLFATVLPSPLSAGQIRAGIADGSLIQLPYDSLRGQTYFQLDLRASKAFVFKERHKVELIAQFFDLTNRANFGGNFNNSIRTSTFGTPAGYIAPNAVIVPKSFAAEMAVQYRF
jgi:hypothetical protein